MYGQYNDDFRNMIDKAGRESKESHDKLVQLVTALRNDPAIVDLVIVVQGTFKMRNGQEFFSDDVEVVLKSKGVELVRCGKTMDDTIVESLNLSSGSIRYGSIKFTTVSHATVRVDCRSIR